MGQRKVVIYTRNRCAYCWHAKRLLKRKGYVFEGINMTGDPEGRAWLACITGRDTVPQVFVEDQPTGGFDDVKASTVPASWIGWYGSARVRRSPHADMCS